ncbi:MAG: glycosyltransferase [Flavobacteriales bacterium]|nr:glycosyltransferase [Flavobacteriales bacterium]
MKLSVIIVNYNVRAYLEQCLRAVFAAMEGVPGEVFVVDNQSTDGSVEMVRERFPQVRLLANTENVGFSRANNQAIREAKGDHILLLNPDTIVGEDVFRTVVAYMDADPKVGGVGVKMIDGTGRFLPESKRGLPTPAVAFYKIIGLARLFPRSSVFGRYHLGHLPEDRTARIEILSGACMFLRKRTLDEVGLLDESFFMYGEDIDLSYRITLGGYENHYVPQARILHYKGESTKKSSVNYVFVFYNAMAIFARKHFTRKGPDLFSALIRGAIYLSAAGALLSRFFHRALLPLLDATALAALLLLAGPHVGVMQWADGAPRHLLPFLSAALTCLALFGAYDRPIRLGHAVKGAAAATLLMAAWWSWRMQAWPGTWALLTCLVLMTGTAFAIRGLLHLLRVKGYALRPSHRLRIAAIGSPERARQALDLLWQTHFGLGRQLVEPPEVLQRTKRTAELCRNLRDQRYDEVVLCAGDLTWTTVIDALERLRTSGAVFKIAQPDGQAIISPNSIESLQDLLVLEAHAVNSPASRRTKRIADVVVSVVLMLTLPVNLWFVRQRRGYVANLWQVLLGRRTWVGYHRHPARAAKLPHLQRGVLDPVRALGVPADALIVDRLNLMYAKDYRVWDDLRYIRRGFALMGS